MKCVLKKYESYSISPQYQSYILDLMSLAYALLFLAERLRASGGGLIPGSVSDIHGP